MTRGPVDTTSRPLDLWPSITVRMTCASRWVTVELNAAEMRLSAMRRRLNGVEPAPVRTDYAIGDL